MKNSIKWFIPVLLLMVCLSCKKNSTTEPPVVVPDTTKPVISLVDPTVGKSYVLGAVLHLQMDLSDNVELKSYKVVIAKSLKGLQTSDWAYTNTWIIAAGKKTLPVNHNEITVPLTVTGNQTTTGNYDMTITCTDTSGNEATTSLVIVLTK
jgi:hypothetical protein